MIRRLLVVLSLSASLLVGTCFAWDSESFIGNDYSMYAIGDNLSNLEDYVYKQAGGAVATLLEIVGEEKFRDGLRQRGTQLNPKYKQLLDQYGIMSERK